MFVTGPRFYGCGAMICAVVLSLSEHRAVAADDEGELIRTIMGVGPEGKGNVEAAKAWRALSGRDVEAIIPILKALDSANDLAANWLRAAIETIVSRESGKPGQTAKLPALVLEAFVLDRSHKPQARRLAFELLAGVDPTRSERFLAGMLNDPGPELRRDAVARAMAESAQLQASGKTNEVRDAYKILLTQARDVDQVDEIVKALRKMGDTVEVAKVFGFLTEWKVVGPFDNAGGKGFAAIYPPELGVDLQAEYQGKSGAVRWSEFASKEDYGDVSMNLPFKHLKGAAAYAYTEFYAAKPGPVELRLGSQNAFKVWLNGTYLFGQDEYHRNKEIDQYPMQAQLRLGKNQILVKVCQNEQTEDWADAWDFQLRICDASGTPLTSIDGGAR